MDRLTVWEKVFAEFNGRPISGSFAVEQGMVKVTTLKGQTATQVGVFNTTWLARYLLRELAPRERRKEEQVGPASGRERLYNIRCNPPRQVAAYPALLLFRVLRHYFRNVQKEENMAWRTPVLVEICIGLEINGYIPADGYVPPET